MDGIWRGLRQQTLRIRPEQGAEIIQNTIAPGFAGGYSRISHAARRTVSRVLYRFPERKPATAIHLGLRLPAGSSDQPGSYPDPVTASLFGLAPSGVYLAPHVAIRAVRSYRTLSALPRFDFSHRGGLLSVALSVGSPRPAVSRHSDP